MSWKAINELMGLAIVDPDFCQELLADPHAAIRKKDFDLTTKELEVIGTIRADNIAEFSKIIMSNRSLRPT